MPNTILREQEVSMLRGEMEILMNERQCLLDTTGLHQSSKHTLADTKE